MDKPPKKKRYRVSPPLLRLISQIGYHPVIVRNPSPRRPRRPLREETMPNLPETRPANLEPVSAILPPPPDIGGPYPVAGIIAVRPDCRYQHPGRADDCGRDGVFRRCDGSADRIRRVDLYGADLPGIRPAPRYYNVRDEIAGSDWRSGGGWAIILDGSARKVTVLEVYGNILHFFGPGWRTIDPAREIRNARGTRSAYLVIDAGDGTPSPYAVVDQNGDVVIDSQDHVDHDNDGTPSQLEVMRWRETTIVSGGRYIRWAYMRFCR